MSVSAAMTILAGPSSLHPPAGQIPVAATSPGIFAAVATAPGIITLYGTGGGKITTDSPARLSLASSVTVKASRLRFYMLSRPICRKVRTN